MYEIIKTHSKEHHPKEPLLLKIKKKKEKSAIVKLLVKLMNVLMANQSY